MNGEWRSWGILTLWTIDNAHLTSGHHARTVTAHCSRRSGSTGEGRIVAHIPELRSLAPRMDGEDTQLGAKGRRCCARIRGDTETWGSRVWGEFHRRRVISF
jgi:hypothetical protein